MEQGRSGGGLCYGYDVVKSFDGLVDPVRGGRTVNETEAEVVRRVFREFAAGASPRAIARRLNGEGILGPSGKLWTDSTIRGHAKRGTALINNELYRDFEILSWDLEPGDAVVFSALTLHAAAGNATAARRRRALSTRWTGDDARFVRRKKMITLIRDPGLKPGDPLDSDLLPVVWRHAD